MSKFTDKFNAFLSTEAQSISSICKASKVERTTIQKLKTGTRHPPKKVLEDFLENTKIGLTDKKELLDLYEIELIGEAKYNARQCVQDIFNQIALMGSEHDQFINPSTKQIQPNIPIEDSIEDSYVLDGYFHIDIFIQQWIKNAILLKKELRLSMPFAFENFFNHLSRIYFTSPDIVDIHHILNFEKRTDTAENATKNLHILSKVLSFSFMAKEGYHPHYFYCNTNDVADRFVPMPYYCCTDESAIVFSGDFEHAIYYKSKDIVTLYNSHFENVLCYTKPLIKSADFPASSIENYLQNMGNLNTLFATYEAQPCFGTLITGELVEKYLSKEIPGREKLVQLLTAVYNISSSKEEKLTSFFSKEGLFHFAQTGEISYFPEGSALPLDVEDRINFMQQIRNSIESGENHFFIVREKYMNISNVAACEIYADGNILFTYNTEKKYSVILINEQSIFESVYDFFENLPSSDLVYSHENAMSIIDECIACARRFISDSTV